MTRRSVLEYNFFKQMLNSYHKWYALQLISVEIKINF